MEVEEVAPLIVFWKSEIVQYTVITRFRWIWGAEVDSLRLDTSTKMITQNIFLLEFYNNHQTRFKVIFQL